MAWTQVAFQYDGTFHGFLCCIYESYMHKEFPIAFYDDEECCLLTLDPVRSVSTVPDHAERVYRSIRQRSNRAAQLLQRAFLTCMDQKEQHLYLFVRKLYREGDSFLHNHSDSAYYPIAKALRHMSGELEKLRGFVRFSDYSGVLGAEIEPKNRVLPLLRRHFCDRYANESFFIYDRTHRDLLLYTKGSSRILRVDSLQLALPSEEETHYRHLWQQFYNSITIQERYNPRCQNTFLPKRYRGTMTEFQPQAAITPPKSPAAAPALSAPTATPALGIHPKSAPSVPESGF